MRRRQLLARTELRRVLNTPQPTADSQVTKSERDAPPPVVKRRPGRPPKAEVMK